VAESRLTPQDSRRAVQAADDVKVREDFTKASVKPDDVAEPSLVTDVQRKFTAVKKMSPLKNFDPNADELPAKGYRLHILVSNVICSYFHYIFVNFYYAAVL